jgi:hypothetical protein
MRREITLGEMIEVAFFVMLAFYVFLRWNLW